MSLTEEAKRLLAKIEQTEAEIAELREKIKQQEEKTEHYHKKAELWVHRYKFMVDNFVRPTLTENQQQRMYQMLWGYSYPLDLADESCASHSEEETETSSNPSETSSNHSEPNVYYAESVPERQPVEEEESDSEVNPFGPSSDPDDDSYYAPSDDYSDEAPALRRFAHRRPSGPPKRSPMKE